MTPCEEAIWNIYLRCYTFMGRNKDNYLFDKYREGNRFDLIGNITLDGVEYKAKYEQLPVDVLLTRYPEIRNNLIQLNLYPSQEHSEDWCEVDNFLVQLQSWYNCVVRKHGWGETSEQSLEKIYLPLLEKLKR